MLQFGDFLQRLLGERRYRWGYENESPLVDSVFSFVRL